MLEHGDELVPTEPGDPVVPQDGGEASRDGLQDEVAGLVAMNVVDGFEPDQVQQSHGAGQPNSGEQRLHATTVEHAGELVVGCFVDAGSELLLESPALGGAGEPCCGGGEEAGSYRCGVALGCHVLTTFTDTRVQ